MNEYVIGFSVMFVVGAVCGWHLRKRAESGYMTPVDLAKAQAERLVSKYSPRIPDQSNVKPSKTVIW